MLSLSHSRSEHYLYEIDTKGFQEMNLLFSLLKGMLYDFCIDDSTSKSLTVNIRRDIEENRHSKLLPVIETRKTFRCCSTLIPVMTVNSRTSKLL